MAHYQRSVYPVNVNGKIRLRVHGSGKFTKPKNRHEHRLLAQAEKDAQYLAWQTEQEAKINEMHEHNPSAVLPTNTDLEMVRRWHLQRAARSMREARLRREFESNDKVA